MLGVGNVFAGPFFYVLWRKSDFLTFVKCCAEGLL